MKIIYHYQVYGSGQTVVGIEIPLFTNSSHLGFKASSKISTNLDNLFIRPWLIDFRDARFDSIFWAGLFFSYDFALMLQYLHKIPIFDVASCHIAQQHVNWYFLEVLQHGNKVTFRKTIRLKILNKILHFWNLWVKGFWPVGLQRLSKLVDILEEALIWLVICLCNIPPSIAKSCVVFGVWFCLCQLWIKAFQSN